MSASPSPNKIRDYKTSDVNDISQGISDLKTAYVPYFG